MAKPSDAPPVSLDNLDLLLRLLDAPKLVFTHATLASRRGRALLASGLLEAAGQDKVYIDPEDEDGTAFEVRLDPEGGRFGFRHPLRGWTDVDLALLRLYKPRLDAILSMLLGDDLRPPIHGPIEVETDLVWEVGSMWLTSAKRTDVWFARRLGDREAWERLQAASAHRPATSHRLVLTPTGRGNLLSRTLPLSTVVPIADVLDPYAPARIDMGRLRALFRGQGSTASAGPLHLTVDDSTLTIHDTVIHFTGDNQKRAIRILFEAYGNREGVIASATLSAAGFGVGTRTFPQAFRKQWPQLKPYLKAHDKLWRFEL